MPTSILNICNRVTRVTLGTHIKVLLASQQMWLSNTESGQERGLCVFEAIKALSIAFRFSRRERCDICTHSRTVISAIRKWSADIFGQIVLVLLKPKLRRKDLGTELHLESTVSGPLCLLAHVPASLDCGGLYSSSERLVSSASLCVK